LHARSCALAYGRGCEAHAHCSYVASCTPHTSHLRTPHSSYVAFAHADR
jgi:hypothetical protein